MGLLADREGAWLPRKVPLDLAEDDAWLLAAMLNRLRGGNLAEGSGVLPS